MIPRQTEAVPERNLVVNAHFRIEPCSSCSIAGYLIVSPRVRVSSLAELSPNAQEALGATLAAATRAIEAVVRPRRVLLCAVRRGKGLGSFPLISSFRLAGVLIFPRSSGRGRHTWSAASRLGTLHFPRSSYG